MARTPSLPDLSGKARSQLGLFLGAYLVYTAGRWLTVSDLAPATEHADGS